MTAFPYHRWLRAFRDARPDGQVDVRPKARARTRRAAPLSTRVLIGALGFIGAAGLFGAGAAFAYWTTGATTNPAIAVADSLPTGATPTATTTAPNASTVDVTFDQGNTTINDVAIPASDYEINLYPAAGGSATPEPASCSGTGTITCVITAVPDGFWVFTDTPQYGTNWVGTESDASGTVTVDTTAPTGSLTYPAASTLYGANWSGALSGTASDATSGVATVDVAVKDTTSGLWFDGSSFAAPSEDFLPASGTTSWSYDLTAGELISGDSYSVVEQATDNATNVFTSGATSFSFSTALPSAAITEPTSGADYNAAEWSSEGATLSGTAAAALGSITSNALTLQNTTADQYWNGAAWQGGAATFAPSGGTETAWTNAFSSSSLVSGDTYSLTDTATDSAGNTQTSSATTFSYNTVAPTATVSAPGSGAYYNVAGWSSEGATLTGTATPAFGTLTADALTLYNTTTTEYWNGAAWQVGTATFAPSGGTLTSWSNAFSATDLTSGDTYSLSVAATDEYGNTGTSATTTFSYNTAAPSAAISAPANDGYYNAAAWTSEGPTLSGTATANIGAITANALTLVNVNTGEYWNGSAWQVGAATFAPSGGTPAAWSDALADSDLTSPDSYTLTDTATDSAGNSATSATTTFTYDTVAPTVSVTYPASGAFVNAAGWSGSITGSASDSYAALGSPVLTIKNTTTDQYWNGTDWQGGATTVAASGTTSWNYALSSGDLTNGDGYTVTATVTDSAGNADTTAATTFGYDTSAPTASVSFPASGAFYNASGWTGSITGLASDGFSGVSAVALSIEDTTTAQYWNGSSFQSSPTTVTATGTTGWGYALSSGQLANGNAYSVTAFATDNADNTGTSAAATFGYDTTAPAAAVTFPVSGAFYNASGWTGSLTGTASDGFSGVASVALTIENTTTSQYWNGTAWQGGATTVAASGTTSWSYALATGQLTDGDGYSVSAEATDLAGNSSTSAATTFGYDTTAPTAAVTYPSNGDFYNAGGWTGTITGTASDALSGVASVALTIEDTTTSQYWNGSTWQGGATTVTPSGTTTWSYGLAGANLTDSNEYSVMALVTDNASISTTASSSFGFDVTAPTTAVTYPANSAYYNTSGWTGTVTGISGDAFSGVATNALTIENTTTAQYWNGSSWQGGAITVAPSGLTSWTYALSIAHLANGDSYSVTNVATDAAGNASSASSASFGYDTTAPAISITYPTSFAIDYYNASGWTGTISGYAIAPQDPIASVTLSIENITTVQYWNGTAWQAGQTAVLASGTSLWSYPLAEGDLANGDTYSVAATATDEAANATATASVFGYDTTPPSAAAVTFPASGAYYNAAGWAGALSGTATDSFSGIATNTLVIEDTTTAQYWNGSEWQSGATTVPATGTSSWTYPFSDANLSNNNHYAVTDTAVDNAGNSFTGSASTFGYDTTPPSAAVVTYPVTSAFYNATAWSGAFTGTAADSFSGVATNALTIEDTTTTQYWNGSSWQGGATTVPATGTTSWTYALASGNLTDNDSYAVTDTATDNAGNTFTGTAVTFGYDTTPPSSAVVTYPVTGVFYNSAGWTGTITGTASDSFSGIAANALTIENTTTTQYWNGSSWQGGATTVTATGTTSWTYGLLSSSLTNGDGYSITDTATDAATNTFTGTTVTYGYDTTAPVVTGTVIGQSTGSSVNGYVAGGASYRIYASVTDSFAGVATVSANANNVTTGATNVSLSSVGGPFTAPGGGSYTYESVLLTANAQDGGGETFTVNGSDNAGNTSTYSANGSVTFDIQLTQPTSVTLASSTTTAGAINVTFSAPSNAPGGQLYTAEACTDAAMTIGCLGPESITSGGAFTGLLTTSPTSYYITVTALASTGYLASAPSSTSGQAAAQSTIQLAPVAAPILADGTGPGTVVATFSAPSNAPGGQAYTVEACTNALMSAGCVGPESFSSGGTISGLVTGTTYYVQVVAVSSTGYLSVTSAQGSVITAYPSISGLSPSFADQGATSQNVVITGTNFVSGVSLGASFSGTGITVNSVTYVSSTSLTANVKISPSAPTGTQSITVINGDGTPTTGTNLFTVDTAPAITTTAPAFADQKATGDLVTLTGTDFDTGSTTVGVAISGSGVTTSSVTEVNSTSITFDVAITSGAATGPRTLTLTNGDGSTATSTFTVDTAPAITTVAPSSVDIGANADQVTLTGTNFDTGSSPVAVAISTPTGITISSVTEVSSTSITFNIAVAGATAGGRTLTLTNGDGSTVTAAFTINAAPTITTVAPSTSNIGATSDLVTLTGTGFDTGSSTVAVAISTPANISITSVSEVSSTSVTFDIAIAAGASTGSHTLTLTNGDGSTATSTFTIDAAPTITTVAPAFADIGATGDLVTLTGTDFDNAPGTVGVSFSGTGVTASSVTYVSATSVTFDVAVTNAATAGGYTLTLTNGDGSTVTHAFTINAAPTITNVSPSVADIGATADQVTLTGANFDTGSSTVAVAISTSTDITISSVTEVNSTSITFDVAITSGAATGPRTLTLTNGDGSTATSTFNVDTAPAITTVAPSSVDILANADQVTLTGANFDTGSSTVAVAISTPTDITISSVTEVSSTSITFNIAVVAGATAGGCTLTLTNGDGSTVTAAFTINAAPTITTVEPASADIAATNDAVTLTGTGYDTGSSTVGVSFNNSGITASSVVEVSSTSVTFELNILNTVTTGSYTLTLTNGDGSTVAHAFTVSAQPAIVGEAPASADVGATNDKVTLTGTTFDSGSNLAVAFSDPYVTASSVTYVSSTSITFELTVASGAATSGDTLTLTNGDGSSATTTFTVNAAPTLTTVAPNTADIGATGDLVTLTGTGFDGGSNLAVAISGTDVTASSPTFVSSTEVTFKVAVTTGASLTARTVTLTNGDGSVATDATSFTPNAAPTLSTVAPNGADISATGDLVTLTGTGFDGGASLAVAISGTDVTASSVTYVSPTEVTFNVAVVTGASLTARTVTLTNGDGSVATDATSFTPKAAPTITTVAPASADVGATNDLVTLTGASYDTGSATVGVSISGTGVTASSVTEVSSTEVTFLVTIASGTTPGSRTLTLTNGDTSTVTHAFTVNAAPTITNVSPATADIGTAGELVTLTGVGYDTGSSTVGVAISSPTDITISSVTEGSSTSVTFDIAITTGAATGAHSLTLTNGDGSTVSATFTVGAVPSITGVSPASADIGATNDLVTLTGTNFDTGSTTVAVAIAGSNDTESSVTEVSSTEVTFLITITTGAVTGAHTLTLTNGDGTTAMSTFTVNAAPAISTVAPATADIGATGDLITFTGTGFDTGSSTVAVAIVAATGITISSVTEVNSTSVTFDLAITSSASTGSHTFTLTNGDGSTATHTFTVDAAPTVTSVSPASEVRNTTDTVQVEGTGFDSGSALNVTFSSNVTVNSVTYESATDIQVNITTGFVSSDTSYNVTVTNGDGSSATGTSLFTIDT